jgi:hypothetical protein
MYSWVSLQHYAVDLMGVNLKCIDAFAVMDRDGKNRRASEHCSQEMLNSCRKFV